MNLSARELKSKRVAHTILCHALRAHAQPLSKRSRSCDGMQRVLSLTETPSYSFEHDQGRPEQSFTHLSCNATHTITTDSIATTQSLPRRLVVLWLRWKSHLAAVSRAVETIIGGGGNPDDVIRALVDRASSSQAFYEEVNSIAPVASVCVCVCVCVCVW